MLGPAPSFLMQKNKTTFHHPKVPEFTILIVKQDHNHMHVEDIIYFFTKFPSNKLHSLPNLTNPSKFLKFPWQSIQPKKVKLGFINFRVFGVKYSCVLATSERGKCTSLVCSCYVASRNSDTREEERKRVKFDYDNPKNFFTKDGESNCMETRLGIVSHVVEEVETFAPLKSNLKKTIMVENTVELVNPKMRRVSWSDAHGKDIAHIQEFEPSVSDDGELGGVGNSCRCAIQ